MITNKKILIFKGISKICAALFYVIGGAKIFSYFYDLQFGTQMEPIFHIPLRDLLLVVGMVEVLVAAFFTATRDYVNSTILYSWLAAMFLTYRVCLKYIGWDLPCSCMGNFPYLYNISPNLVDKILRIILLFIIIGALYNILFILKYGKQHCNSKGVGPIIW